MKRISNFTIIFVTIAILVVVVVTKTTMEINKDREKKLMYALNSKIEYAFKRCRLENRCSNDITLGILIENGYLNEQVNPITKEVISEDVRINYVNGETIIDY